MMETVRQLDADPGDAASALSRVVAQEQDAFWRSHFTRERYWRADRDYEDYAPAFCVGYAGCAQYGGDFEDARHSLHANWQRIRSDSRLSLEEAMHAVKAAWDRMAMSPNRPAPPSSAASIPG